MPDLDALEEEPDPESRDHLHDGIDGGTSLGRFAIETLLADATIPSPYAPPLRPQVQRNI